MKDSRSFEPDLNLMELTAAVNEVDGRNRALIEIGHQDGATVMVFDTDRPGAGAILLVPGVPLPKPPGQAIATGKVFITGQLQTVTAYRVA